MNTLPSNEPFVATSAVQSAANADGQQQPVLFPGPVFDVIVRVSC